MASFSQTDLFSPKYVALLGDIPNYDVIIAWFSPIFHLFLPKSALFWEENASFGNKNG